MVDKPVAIRFDEDLIPADGQWHNITAGSTGGVMVVVYVDDDEVNRYPLEDDQ